jgi:hypothetical protein
MRTHYPVRGIRRFLPAACLRASIAEILGKAGTCGVSGHGYMTTSKCNKLIFKQKHRNGELHIDLSYVGGGSIHWAIKFIGKTINLIVSRQHVVRETLMCNRRTTEWRAIFFQEIQLDILKKRRIRGKCTNYRNLLRLAHHMPEK